jgi:hypothetical protein
MLTVFTTSFSHSHSVYEMPNVTTGFDHINGSIQIALNKIQTCLDK